MLEHTTQTASQRYMGCNGSRFHAYLPHLLPDGKHAVELALQAIRDAHQQGIIIVLFCRSCPDKFLEIMRNAGNMQ
jgi:hypothetical protein